MAHDETIKGRALDWALRTGDPEFTDWEAFTLWLEESPEHARAYDEVGAAIADGAAVVADTPQVANDDEPATARPVRRRWAVGAIAASLAFAVALGMSMGRGGDRYAVETGPGEITTITLSDGTHLALSGDTRLELDRDDPRVARLERGQAVFTVRHDAKNPFVVLAGDDKLVDAGTVFEVELDKTRMQVAVSEGLVVFNPDRQGVKVAPGNMLTRRAGAGAYSLAPIARDQVGEWMNGRLTFEGASLDEVAARLSRMTGVAFAARPGSGGALSGSVLIAPLRKDPQSLGALLGVAVHREGERWIISAD